MPSDKLNQVDYRWHIVRVPPRQERKLAALLESHKGDTGNILEVYCPTHTTVTVRCGGRERLAPLFAGSVFVLSTHQALADFLRCHFPEGRVLYDRKPDGDTPARLWTVPEAQMRAFMDFNDNYADQLVVLERPYSDYAYNPKTNQPNEIVRVLDGPLAGREGYIAKFRRDKRLVFQMKGPRPGSYFTVSLPHVWNFHVVRLHNTEGDRQTLGTQKERAADLLLGILQAVEPEGQVIPLFHAVMERLTAGTSLIRLSQDLSKRGHEALARRLAVMTSAEARQLLTLARYEREFPGYLRQAYPALVLRPFLTPTSGLELLSDDTSTDSDASPATMRQSRTYYEEIIRRVDITEEVYYPSRGQSGEETTSYYAHIGVKAEGDTYILFANWDMFLREYFLTAGNARRKLMGDMARSSDHERVIESFRTHAPLLYKVLTDPRSPVKPIEAFPIGDRELNVMAIRGVTDPESAQATLIHTCVDICQELNASSHLAVWRRYLRSVWLHR